VETRIFYGIIVLFFISTTTVFAQEPFLSITTDDNHYDEGDTIVISGNVKTRIGETPLIIQLFTEEQSLIDVAQITVAQDGTFTKTFLAEGALWKHSGEYLIIASYALEKVETGFSYTPKSESIETTTDFEVDAGSYGTFDVEYTIKGGTIKDMIVDTEQFAIIVQIDSTDEGTITLDLPREFIGAEKQNGKDDTFIILIDGIEVSYQESLVYPNSRIITVNFEEGDSDIEIIGTYVVPEFGTIVMMILIVGIMTVILASRNKLQIKI
jgi:predicted secreted protein with PEFG-CTERM motif